MEMTLSDTNEVLAADFTNRAANNGSMSPMATVAGVLLGLFTGPGLATASPSAGRCAMPVTREPVAHAPSKVENASMVAPAAELVTRIKEGWRFNMTELADILGVTRPTLYNWLKGKGSPDAEKFQRLQVIAATARTWSEQTDGKNLDYILDYTGPQANELTIRDYLKSTETTADQIRDLIPSRISQYQRAYAESRKLLGDPPPPPRSMPRESARRLNALWAENAKKLHRFRNSSS